MVVEASTAIRKTSQYVLGSSFLNNFLGGPVVAAITISFLMIIIVMIMYPAKKHTPFSTVCKLFIYMLLTSVAVISLHDAIVKNDIEEKYREMDHRNRMGLVSGSYEYELMKQMDLHEQQPNQQPSNQQPSNQQVVQPQIMQPQVVQQPIAPQPSVIQPVYDPNIPQNRLNGPRPLPYQPNMYS